jgi:hypothetical protein
VSVHPAEQYAGEIGTAEQWRRREPPLVPAAVLGIGVVAPALAAAAHARIGVGAELRAAADPEYLVVLGTDDALPWADGARYLGWDGRALTLTTHEVVPAADLWRDAAIAREHAEPASLVVVLPEQILISAMPLRPADPAALLAMYSLEEPEPCGPPELPAPRTGGMAVRPPHARDDRPIADTDTRILGITRRPTVVTGEVTADDVVRASDETRPGVS